MIRTVFYSWQSSLPSNVCRNFIQTCLKKAVRQVHKDETTTLEPILERDTNGLAGSPDIVDAIFRKILFADAFVADVSISGAPRLWNFWGLTLKRKAPIRPAPNPNVLVELGFAVSHVGWEQTILVLNTAFGEVSELPFDLRGRRTATYYLAPDSSTEERKSAREQLTGALTTALKSILEPISGSWSNLDRREPRWWGYWSYDIRGMAGGNLFIREVSGRGFIFSLDVQSGAHSGTLDGFAQFTGRFTAEAHLESSFGGSICRIAFRKAPDRPTEIKVEEVSGCEYWHGMGATYSGVFSRAQERVYDCGFLDELDMQRLFFITGPYFGPLLDACSGGGDYEWHEAYEGRAFFGLVRGLATIIEGIIMRGRKGQLWAAYIDGENVRYFTTQQEDRHQPPATIQHWRSRFMGKTLVPTQGVDAIPRRDGELV